MVYYACPVVTIGRIRSTAATELLAPSSDQNNCQIGLVLPPPVFLATRTGVVDRGCPMRILRKNLNDCSGLVRSVGWFIYCCYTGLLCAAFWWSSFPRQKVEFPNSLHCCTRNCRVCGRRLPILQQRITLVQQTPSSAVQPFCLLP